MKQAALAVLMLLASVGSPSIGIAAPWPCVDRAIAELDDRTSSAEVIGHAAVDKCLGPDRAKWNAAYGEEMVERLMRSFYQQGTIRVLEQRAARRREH